MWNSSLPLLAGLVGLAMAASTGRATAFSVRFSWTGIPACERISPELHLSDVPPGTKKLHCEMKDLDVPGFRHGGSTITYAGGGAVARGAIHYVGPCRRPALARRGLRATAMTNSTFRPPLYGGMPDHVGPRRALW